MSDRFDAHRARELTLMVKSGQHSANEILGAILRLIQSAAEQGKNHVQVNLNRSYGPSFTDQAALSQKGFGYKISQDPLRKTAYIDLFW